MKGPGTFGQKTAFPSILISCVTLVTLFFLISASQSLYVDCWFVTVGYVLEQRSGGFPPVWGGGLSSVWVCVCVWQRRGHVCFLLLVIALDIHTIGQARTCLSANSVCLLCRGGSCLREFTHARESVLVCACIYQSVSLLMFPQDKQCYPTLL